MVSFCNLLFFSFHYVFADPVCFFFVNCPFIPSLYFIGLDGFYLLIYRHSLHVLDVDPLPVISGLSLTYLFPLLTRCLKLWILIKSKILLFYGLLHPILIDTLSSMIS